MPNHPVRTSAKAILVDDDKILLTKNIRGSETFYLLPGGGQNLNEDLKRAVQRECMEELGADVVVHDLIFVRDYIEKNHQFADIGSDDYHQMELMFFCTLPDNHTFEPPMEEDMFQVDVEWVSINKLKDYNLYPSILKRYIPDYLRGEEVPVYLGDVN